MSVSEATIRSDVESTGLSYPDFVGYINQWNVLPGAYATLSEWALFSHLCRDSSVLQLGCTTGFQARELALLSGCATHGLDLSPYAIQAARWNAKKYAPGARISYERADALRYVSATKYTHVVVGAGLRFFAKPFEVISRMPDWLVDGGHLLASPFFIHRSVPDKLLELAESTFGIVPTTAGYDEILQPYTVFEIMHESRKTLVPEPESQLERYCEATIARAAELHDRQDDRDWRQQQFERLLGIRRVSNVLREYQGYTVLVCRYRSSVYPNRYVELF